MFLTGAPGVDASELGDGSLFIEDPHSVSTCGESEFAEMTKYTVNIWRNCVLDFDHKKLFSSWTIKIKS